MTMRQPCGAYAFAQLSVQPPFYADRYPMDFAEGVPGYACACAVGAAAHEAIEYQGAAVGDVVGCGIAALAYAGGRGRERGRAHGACCPADADAAVVAGGHVQHDAQESYQSCP